MCKYCRHLKELKNRDKLYYESLIRAWRRTCLRQESLLRQALIYLESPFVSSVYFSEDICDRIKKELRKEVI